MVICQRGFSFLELAVAMFILTLLLGSILVPLTTQVEQRQISETQRILESARDAYQKARQDPMIVRHAAVALDRAGQSLQEADRLWTQEKDITEVEHLAYLTEKRVEIARVTAERRVAAEEIQKVRSQRP